jgi:hypothetical protein
VELLSSLREAPTIGRYYLVPVVRYGLFNKDDEDWPVLGPIHHDRELINFPDLHYHLDGRFLSARQMRRFVSEDEWMSGQYSPGSTLNGKPLSQKRQFGGVVQPKLPPRPTLKKLLCRREIQPWVVGKFSERWGLNKHYGEPAAGLHRRDGRVLCPHRKVDLSQFPADLYGVVVCPLHGMRVCVRKAVAA